PDAWKPGGCSGVSGEAGTDATSAMKTTPTIEPATAIVREVRASGGRIGPEPIRRPAHRRRDLAIPAESRHSRRWSVRTAGNRECLLARHELEEAGCAQPAYRPSPRPR